MCKAAEIVISTETRYIKGKARRRRIEAFERKQYGKRSVYFVNLRDSCITANGGKTDLDERTQFRLVEENCF